MKNQKGEFYDQIISLYEQALIFYGDEKNYVRDHKKDGNVASLIEIDRGHQASFAIKTAKELIAQLDSLKNIYNKDTTDFVEEQDDVSFLKKIEELKKKFEK